MVVEIPALDALVEFLKANEQAEIDGIADKVKASTAILAKANATLKQSVDSISTEKE